MTCTYKSLLFEGVRQIAVRIWEVGLQFYGSLVGVYGQVYQPTSNIISVKTKDICQ